MLPSFLLSMREGLEAAMLVGIVLGALRQMNRRDMVASVWGGVICASVISIAVAIILTSLGLSLHDPAEAIFEGITMILATGVLTWMIFWMSRQSRHIKGNLEAGVRQAALSSGAKGLFVLAFLSVVREGIELALFLTAATFASNATQTITGAVLGLAAAVVAGWALFATSVKLDLRRFFKFTGILLIFFAAGLVARAVYEFVLIGWLPALIDHVWDLNPLLNEESTLGQILGVLFGYTGSPSLMVVISYLGYFIAIFAGLRIAKKPEVSVLQAQS